MNWSVNQLRCTTMSLGLHNVHKARYLGVTLCSGKYFGVDFRSAKSNFYSSLNNLFHSAAIIIRMNLLSCIYLLIVSHICCTAVNVGL